MSSTARKTLGFAIFVLLCSLLAYSPLRQLLHLALTEDTYSHILLVPAITAALLWMNRASAADWNGSTPLAAAMFFVAGSLLLVLGEHFASDTPAGDGLAVAILGVLVLIWSGILFFYGAPALQRYLFPFGFLLLAVPLPRPWIDGFVEWLRAGSATVTDALFHLTGTPVLREGYVFVVPGAAIDIAPECSGIRSAIAMLVLCLLAGYLFLRSGWARTALLVAAAPMLVIKNGIRIVTLTLLATHIDPSFLTGKLHHQGGFVFFVVGMLILWPVLLWLQAMERRTGRGGTTNPSPVSS